MNILVLAAHPDDETLGCGATIHKLAKNNHVSVLTFTDGLSSRTAGGDRRDELKKAAQILNFEIVETFNFPDNRMDSIPLLNINQAVEDTLAKSNIQPDIIMTHNPWCLNVDHRKIFECTQVISRMTKCKVMCYEVPSSTEWNTIGQFRPNSYVELSDDSVDAKISALQSAYKDELRSDYHPRSIDSIISTMRANGSVIGAKYAERFMITKEVL